MPAAVRLEQYLGRVGVRAGQLQHDRAETLALAVAQTRVPCGSVVKEELLIDLKGVVMAVIPAQSELDLPAVNHKLGRQLQKLTSGQADNLFPDCMPGIHPPVGMAYGVTTIIDQSVFSWPKAHMQSGCPCTLICIDNRGIQAVYASSIKGEISSPSQHLKEMMEGQSSSSKPLSLDQVAKKLKRLYKLPPMPAVAMKILNMVADPESDVTDLAKLIECDPSLAAQVLRYSRSSLFSYRGNVKTVRDAVNLVLGFDRVANLAMGLASGQAFSVPKDGAIGLDAFWKHALYASMLCQKLAEKLPDSMGVDAGTAGLAGLLHNFGLLLIGHLFPPEFTMLDKLVDSEPDQPLSTLEQQVFGMGGAQEVIALGHGSIGGVLLRLWDLPEEIVKVAGMHQNLSYRGEAEHYVHLIQLVNELLKFHGIGDEHNVNDTKSLFELLELDPEETTEFVNSLIENGQDIDELAKGMSA